MELSLMSEGATGWPPSSCAQGNYKVTVNKCILAEEYLLPNVEDILATLAGGKVFSKIDLSFAYQQLELDAESKQYLTINT